jgi:hypothetical protein
VARAGHLAQLGGAGGAARRLLLTYYMLRKATGLVEGNLVIHPERALGEPDEGSYGLVFSQSVLLALVGVGLSRDAAYRIVQRDARAAWEERRPVPVRARRGPRGHADGGARRGLRPVPRSLRHVDRFADALEELAP